MPSALVRKLSVFADLDREDLALLEELTSDVRLAKPKRDIVADGERPEHLHLIVQGWAARYKILPDGPRQITAFLIPGDFFDHHMALLGRMDHGIIALTPCKIAFVASDLLDRLTRERPALARALWWGMLLDQAILRNWVVNIGRRGAYERIAHLLCELHARMTMVGLVDNDRFDMPMIQRDLADATGLTSVHVNRTIQKLRVGGLIELSGQVLRLKDVSGLSKVAGFDPSYLHIVRRTTTP